MTKEYLIFANDSATDIKRRIRYHVILYLDV